jgi:lipopolysaccharide transport system permease protein
MTSINQTTDTLLPIEGNPTVIIQPAKGLINLNLRQVWQYHELLYFLAWREVKVRYKQTAIGAAWAILQPLLTMIIFAVIFGVFAKIPSDDIHYPIFVYAALLPWTYFSQAVERSGNSMVENARLITKIYFPRLIIPLASVLTPIIDVTLALLVLIPLMLIYKVYPSPRILFLPFFLLMATLTALSISLWLSALNVRYRDVRYIIPFILQVGLYASPVVYPISIVPERWQLLFSLNPMVGVIDGFRWALLGQTTPNLLSMSVSGIMVFILFIGGLYYFKYVERTFADII